MILNDNSFGTIILHILRGENTPSQIRNVLYPEENYPAKSDRPGLNAVQMKLNKIAKYPYRFLKKDKLGRMAHYSIDYEQIAEQELHIIELTLKGTPFSPIREFLDKYNLLYDPKFSLLPALIQKYFENVYIKQEKGISLNLLFIHFLRHNVDNYFPDKMGRSKYFEGLARLESTPGKEKLIEDVRRDLKSLKREDVEKLIRRKKITNKKDWSLFWFWFVSKIALEKRESLEVTS